MLIIPHLYVLLRTSKVLKLCFKFGNTMKKIGVFKLALQFTIYMVQFIVTQLQLIQKKIQLLCNSIIMHT
jgi:hypothetical protein